MLLTKPPKIEGASIGEKKSHKRKLSGGEELLKGFLQVHESAAHANMGATPRRYIAFLNTYQQVYNNKKNGIEKRQHHLQVCSDKTLTVPITSMQLDINEKRCYYDARNT